MVVKKKKSNQNKAIDTQAEEDLLISRDIQNTEYLYKDLVEKAGIAIFIDDLEGNLKYVNNHFAKLFGYTKRELKNRTFQDFVHPGEVDRGNINHRRRLKKGFDLASYEVRGIKKDGTVLNLEISTTPIQYKNKIIGFRSYIKDITARKRYEKDLKKTELEWLMTFNIVPDLLAIIDKEHKLVRINIPMADRLGIKAHEACGKTCHELVHGTSEPPDFCPHAKLLKDGKSHSTEVFEEKLDGYFNVSVSPIYNDDGTIRGSVHVARDITEQKKISDELKKAKDGLEIRVKHRTLELEALNERLKNERQALENKNIALKEILEQIENGKRDIADIINGNIQNIILPLLRGLEPKLKSGDKLHLNLIENSLQGIASPLTQALPTVLSRLSPREIQICNMIKNGLTSKEIAQILNTSEGTVRFQRKNIRKKLDLTNKKISLADFLEERMDF